MGFFKTLVNNSLGTRKEYAVKDLGIFTCKVCDWWQNEHYTWFSTVQLPFYSETTFILIKGDASAPLPQQVLNLQILLENWKSMIIQVDSVLANESKLAHKKEIYTSWQNKFYPEEISTSVKDNNGWEITFTKDDLDDYFNFIWKNNTVRNLTLH